MKRPTDNKRRLMLYGVLTALLLLAVGVYAYSVYLDRKFTPQGLSVFPPSPGLGDTFYVLPIGDINRNTLDMITNMIASDFGKPVKVLSRIEVPYFPEGRAGQIKADFIRSYVTDKLGIPKDTYRIVAIIEEDIYTDGFNFIFGQATMGGIMSLVSVNRLMPVVDGGEITDEENSIYYQRTRKLVRHELGHTFGLTHCSDSKCVMHFHEDLTALDEGSEYFCDRCKAKLMNRVNGIRNEE